jgi:hypothetical protein
MSDQLWELIHQMSPSEKSSFKKQIRTGEGKEDLLYIRMFNFLNNSTEYDDRSFSREFGHGNSVSRMKNYLYELMLKVLIELGSNSDNILRSKNYLNASWVLFQKGLYGQSRKQVEKAIDMAVTNSDLYTESEALSLKRLINLAELNIQGVRETIEEEGRLRELIVEVQDFELLYYSFASFSFKKGNVVNEAERILLNELLKHPRLTSETNCRSLVARSYFHRIFTLYYAMTGDYHSMYQSAINRYNLLNEANNAQFDTQNMINTLNNLVEACLIINRTEEALTYCKEIQSIKTSSMYFEARKMIRYTILQIQILIQTNSMDKDLDKNIDLCLDKYHRFIRPDEKLELLFLIITMHFNKRGLKEVKKWIKVYYQLSKSKTRIDLQLYIMIINIYLNYLTKDYDHMNYLIRNTERFERNEGLLDVYELKLLEILKSEIKKSRLNHPKEDSLNELKDNLSILPQKRNEVSMAKYIDF